MSDVTGLALAFAVGMGIVASIGAAFQANVGGVETNAATLTNTAGNDINAALVATMAP